MNRPAQQGSVLIAVLAALAIIAAVARMLSLQQAGRAELVSTEEYKQAAEYLSEAGLRHALWQARASTNGQYPAAINGMLPGQGTYKAIINPNTGTPITVTSVGTALSGAQFVSTRTYQLPCAGKTEKTLVINTYADKMQADMFYQGISSAFEPGYFDPRANAGKEARVVMGFSLGNIPKGVPIVLAELLLNVGQHDASMEGGQLLVNRVTQAWEHSKVDWTYAVIPKKYWATAGGDYTPVDEASTVISASATEYAWDITAMVDGWVNGKFSHYGLILRANVPGSEGADRLQLKRDVGSTPPEQKPRVVVTYCS